MSLIRFVLLLGVVLTLDDIVAAISATKTQQFSSGSTSSNHPILQRFWPSGALRHYGVSWMHSAANLPEISLPRTTTALNLMQQTLKLKQQIYYSQHQFGLSSAKPQEKRTRQETRIFRQDYENLRQKIFYALKFLRLNHPDKTAQPFKSLDEAIKHAIKTMNLSLTTQEPTLAVKMTVDGGYGNWGSWSPCSLSCGGGSQRRNRVCNNPAPAHGGSNCADPDKQTRSCNKGSCPENAPERLPEHLPEYLPEYMPADDRSQDCVFDVDVVFLLDTSDGVDTTKVRDEFNKDFEKILDVVNQAVDWIDKLPSQDKDIRMGIFEYGAEAKRLLPLQQRNVALLKGEIKRIRDGINNSSPGNWDRAGGKLSDTNIPAALESAANMFRRGGRTHARKYTIIITNGRCNLNNNNADWKCRPGNLEKLAKPLRTNKAKEHIFAIGTGKANKAELKKITGDPEKVKIIKNYEREELTSIEEFLNAKLRKTLEDCLPDRPPQKPPQKPCGPCPGSPCCTDCLVKVLCHCFDATHSGFKITVLVNSSLQTYQAQFGPSGLAFPCLSTIITNWNTTGVRPFTNTHYKYTHYTHKYLLDAGDCGSKLEFIYEPSSLKTIIQLKNTLKLTEEMKTNPSVNTDEIDVTVGCNCTVKADASANFEVLKKRRSEWDVQSTSLCLSVSCGKERCCFEDEKQRRYSDPPDNCLCEKEAKECCLKEDVCVDFKWCGGPMPIIEKLALEIFADNCWATNDSNGNSGTRQDLLKDGCGIQTDIKFKGDIKGGRFCFKAFRFKGVLAQPKVFIHCQLVICKKNDDDSLCSRKRRACPDTWIPYTPIPYYPTRGKRSVDSGSYLSLREVKVGPIVINDAPRMSHMSRMSHVTHVTKIDKLRGRREKLRRSLAQMRRRKEKSKRSRALRKLRRSRG